MQDKKFPPFAKIDVGIDKCFTAKEKANIIEALMNWQDATCGIIQFQISNMSISELIMHDDDPNTWYAINFVKVYSTDDMVKKREKKFGPLSGLAVFLEDTIFTLVVVDKLFSKKNFIELIMHETGHMLGLKHGPKDTIMYKYSLRKAKITHHDICELINYWRKFFLKY